MSSDSTASRQGQPSGTCGTRYADRMALGPGSRSFGRRRPHSTRPGHEPRGLRPDPSHMRRLWAGRSAELAPDNVLATQVAGLLVTEIEPTAHRNAHPVRRHARGTPSVRHGHDLLPVGGILRHVGRIINLVELGGVFGHEAVGLDEIGKHVVAGTVPADAPRDLKAVIFDTTSV